MNINNLATPSILSAIQKLRLLLTRKEKMKWVGIVAFALCTSLLEVVTASVIVVFAQVMNQPEVGQKYLSMVGFAEHLSPGKIVLYIAIIVGVIYLIKNTVAAVEVFYQNFTIQKMNYHFKNKLLHRYAQADYELYLTRNSSLGLQVVGGDAELIFSGGMVSLAGIMSEGIIFICLLALIVFMKISLALMVFSIGALLWLIISKKILPQFYRWGQRMQEATLQSTQNLMQFFHAFKEIVLLGKRDVFVDAYQFHSRKKSRVLALQTASNALPRMVIEVLFVGLFVATIAFLCLEYESPVQMIGILGGYLYAGFRLMPGLNRIINQLNIFKGVLPSIERVYTEHNIIADKENYLNIPEFSFEKCISLNHVDFSYPNANKNALSNINLEIRKGECIGIVGETGSGKSTLVDVILGLLNPSSGTVLIDKKYPVNAYQWHQKIGYVPQSIYLIDDTIQANIAFGEKPEAIDHQLLNQVIDFAQLRSFIAQLPDGAKTIVGERGIRLSGGERQRIAIARALYTTPEVLIFDEATAALDNKTEASLMETVHAVSQYRTVIMVAHRLTTLKDCDRIIMMQNGVIKQITDYQDLLAHTPLKNGEDNA